MSKSKHTGFDAPFLDNEEQAMIEQAEKSTQAADLSYDDATAKWAGAVKKTMKRKPMTIRVQEKDIMKIKRLASQQGIPYQTLISSVIHRIASGEIRP